ncbi:MAG: TolC family protein [Limnohabitans sp.]|nr:TolC family protein [Limnohabitans sp.]
MLCALASMLGCESGLQSIDRQTTEKLRESAESMGGNAIYPEYDPNRYESGSYFPDFPENADNPATVNPKADELSFTSIPTAKEDAESIAARFEKMARDEPNSRLFTFDDSIAYAIEHSNEYLTAEEAYLLVAIRLLIEERRWQLLPSNVTTATFANDGTNGRFNNAVSIVDELGVSQRLPFGGEVAAAFVVQATQQLDDYLQNNDTQSADIVLEAAFPLLRGFGDVALEPLIQQRRNLIYAARNFEQFRRDFFQDLADDYLTLVLQLQGIANGERQVERSAAVESRMKALVESGRTEPFQADLATQNTLFALDRLSNQREVYRLTLDRFKTRIGMPVEQPIAIEPTLLKLPIPDVDPKESLAVAFRYRLDLQTSRDIVEDFERKVDVARNALLADLDVVLSNNLPTNPTMPQAGVQFSPDDNEFAASLVFSMPLDRVTEDLQLRQSQILLEQAKRSYYLARDNAAVSVRQSARGIQTAQFSLVVQEKNVQAAMNRQAAIDAAPDRATARDRTEAVDALRRAQDSLDSARRNLQLAILRYLNNTGQMRIAPNGKLIPLPGMDVGEEVGPGIVDTSP